MVVCQSMMSSLVDEQLWRSYWELGFDGAGDTGAQLLVIKVTLQGTEVSVSTDLRMSGLVGIDAEWGSSSVFTNIVYRLILSYNID